MAHCIRPFETFPTTVFASRYLLVRHLKSAFSKTRQFQQCLVADAVAAWAPRMVQGCPKPKSGPFHKNKKKGALSGAPPPANPGRLAGGGAPETVRFFL